MDAHKSIYERIQEFNNEMDIESMPVIIDDTPENIFKKVCKYYNSNIDAASIKTRKREIVQQRQISHYFSKELTKYSLSYIGFQIGNKDHATVLHSCKTVKNLMKTDRKYREQIEEIEKRLK